MRRLFIAMLALVALIAFANTAVAASAAQTGKAKSIEKAKAIPEKADITPALGVEVNAATTLPAEATFLATDIGIPLASANQMALSTSTATSPFRAPGARVIVPNAAPAFAIQ